VTPTNTPDYFQGDLQILAVFPHPVKDTGATILLGVPFGGTVTLTLYNLKGEQVWQTAQPCPYMGYFDVVWDANNTYGKAVSYGEYYLTAVLDSNGRTRKKGRWISVVR
jgi:hypothetical protein